MSGWLQPMLIEIDEELVLRRAGIPRPDMRLVKAHEVKKLFGKTITTVCQRFRVPERSMCGLNDARPALNVCRRAEVPRWRTHANSDLVPRFKFGRHCHPLDRAMCGLPY